MASEVVPNYIAARSPPFLEVRVVPGSMPVVASGDVRQVRLAILGWNPSKLEFLGPSGRLLDGREEDLELRYL
jgi:hypothetical protein